MPTQRLKLGKKPMWLGVCSGLATYFKIDPALIRVAWVFVTVFTGFLPGVLIYVISAWVINHG
jgi:phage shock protein C